MSCSAGPIDARRVSILPSRLRDAFARAADAVRPFAALLDLLDLKERPTSAPNRKERRRLISERRRLGLDRPDPDRFGRPPSAEVRKTRKALRRKLARSA